MLLPLIAKLRRHLKEAMQVDHSPGAIAGSFALGTAIAVLPSFGMGVFIGAILSLIFKRLNQIALFSAFAFWNPAVLVPVYLSSYAVGDLLFGNLPPQEFEVEFIAHLYKYSTRFLFGNLIVASTLTLVSYVVVYRAVMLYIRHIGPKIAKSPKDS